MAVYGAYLEDYHFIKMIVPLSLENKNLRLKSKNDELYLTIFKKEIFNDEIHLYASFNGYINLQEDYYLYINDLKAYHLNLGKITRSKRFDLDYYNEIPLGAIYNEEYTIFRFWSPVCKEAYVVIDGIKYPCKYLKKGVYEAKVEGNLDEKAYYYLIRINEEFIETIDPYSYAVTKNAKMSYVLNPKKFVKMNEGFYKGEKCLTKALIEEISIRDLTSLYDGGTFKDAYLSINKDYGLGYLKDIGFTHLQIMPVYNFGGVDEEIKDHKNPKFKYNWGYNPVSHKALSNFLTCGNGPYDSINEFRTLVDTIHKNKMGVCLDMVFNHVYDAFKNSLALLCPGYSFHTDERGFLTSASGCGNDVNSCKLMMRRYILDTTLYFQETFKIDGFRFDLMNLIDVKTMNALRTLLLMKNPSTLTYGEGWKIPCSLDFDDCSMQENFWELDGYSFFNDEFRTTMKCNFDATEKGFTMGGKTSSEKLFSALTGYSLYEEKYNAMHISINYLECHDGLTYYDALTKLNKDLTINQINDYLCLSLGVITFSLGCPFYHLGEEFGRTKQGIDNSYNLDDKINGVKYPYNGLAFNNKETLKDMIAIRKEYSCFMLDDAKKARDQVKEAKVFNKEHHAFGMRYYDTFNKAELLVIYKNNYDVDECFFAPGNTLIFDGRKKVNIECQTLKLDKPGVYIIKK